MFARFGAYAVAVVLSAFGIDVEAGEIQPALVTIAGGVVAIVEVVSSKMIRERITPSADPRDDEGNRLVVETSSGS